MDGPNSNMLTADDLMRAYESVKVTDRAGHPYAQQPYMIRDEVVKMEEDGALFGNGVAGDDDALFGGDFQPDAATTKDDVSDGGVYQETDVGQIVTNEGEMNPLPDPALYPQTTASMYGGMGEDVSDAEARLRELMGDGAKSIQEIAKGAEALEQEGKISGEQADQIAATAEATAAASKKKGKDAVKEFQSTLAQSKEARSAARQSGTPIPATQRAVTFLKKHGLWIAIGGAVLIAGTAGVVMLKRRGYV